MALAHPLPFGALLKRERLARGLTQEALAERAGLSTRAISDLERGVNRAPRKETLRLLAEALQLSADEHARLEAAYRWSTAAPAISPVREQRVSSDAAHVPLAGRARELARIGQHLAGEGPLLLLLAGEPGIGKSRLLEEASQRASAQGWTVLAGGCHRQSGQAPYTPLLGALAAYLRRQPLARGRLALEGCAWLVRLLPELAEQGLLPSAAWKLPPEQERRLMFAAVERLLTNVAGPAGTLLVLDDLQWAGTDALEMLSILVRSAKETPLRVIGSYRSTEVRPDELLAGLVADLAATGLAAQLDLAPLAPAEAAALLTNLLEGSVGEDAALAGQIVQRTGGIPFFLVSCAQAVRQQPGTAGAVPWTVAQSIRQRVAALPETGRELLGAAAVIGRNIPGALLQALALQPEQAALAALEGVCLARLLLENAAGDYTFAHDLIREVILADLSVGRRRRLHRLVAQALEQQPGEPPLAQLAYHWVSAGEGEKAVVAQEQAGDHAQALYAFAEAEGYYRDTLAQLDALGRTQERARVYEKLGNALTIQDCYDEALTVLEHALQGYRESRDQEGQWRTLAQIGMVHGNRGSSQEGLSQLEPVIEGVESGLVSHGLAVLYAALAFLAVSSGRYSKQLAFAEHAARLAQALGDDKILIQSNCWISIALFSLGHPQESQPPMLEAMRLAEQVGDLWTTSMGLNSFSHLHLLHGDFDQGQVYVKRACEAAEQLGWPTAMAYMGYCRGYISFFRGEWAEARAQYEQAVVLGREGGGNWGVGYPAFGRGFLALVQGQEAVAAEQLAIAIAHAERSHDLGLLRMLQRVLAEADLLVNHPEDARARLAPLLDQSEHEELDVNEVLPILAWATLDAGDSAEAEAMLSACLRRAQEQETHIVVPDALRVQARLERQRGRWAEAEAALEEALALCRSMSYPFAEAKTLYEYGRMRLQQDMVQEARQCFEAALAICARLGERLYARQIEAELIAI
jgi:transcriptional regulator with XRE-family HTH domain